MQTANQNNADEADKTLDKDTVHEILSDSRRRAVLRILNEKGDVDKGDLASLVAADECDKTVAELDSQERKRVQVSLIQVHMCKLKDSGVVEQESNTVSITPKADKLLWHLEGQQDKQCISGRAEQLVKGLF